MGAVVGEGWVDNEVDVMMRAVVGEDWVDNEE